MRPTAALAPQPGLAAVEELVAQARGGGTPGRAVGRGRRRRSLPRGVDLAAYRIVQEALTNVRKQAGPARARVRVRYGRDALELEITDDGRAGANGGGHGDGSSACASASPSTAGSWMPARDPTAASPFAHASRSSASRVATVRAGRSPHRREQHQESDAVRGGGPSPGATPARRVRGARRRPRGRLRDRALGHPVPGTEARPRTSRAALHAAAPLRRRFPFAAPAFAFACRFRRHLRGRTRWAAGHGVFAALLLAFWAVGAHDEARHAVAGVAIGFASLAVIAQWDVRVDYDEPVRARSSPGARSSVAAFALRRRRGGRRR